jgi:PAS domain S-box-containing protein
LENSRKKGSVSFETTIRAKDGRLIDCEVTAAHVSYEGEEYIFGFLRDITARNRL